MAATPPGTPSDVPPPGSTPTAADAQRQARYNYLVGRLRGRQITMEEATELFAVMQAMLRASEGARRAVAAVGPTPPLPAARAAPRAPAASAAPDDMFLVGLLAMGAGAGLLAAMARRLAEGPASTGSPSATTARRSS